MLQIQDLLRPESCNMQIREGDNGVYVSGVEEVLQPDYNFFIAALVCNFSDQKCLTLYYVKKLY